MEANTRQAYMGRFKAGQAKEGPHIEAIWAVQASFTDLCAYCFLSLLHSNMCVLYTNFAGEPQYIYIEESKCFFHEELTELYIYLFGWWASVTYYFYMCII